MGFIVNLIVGALWTWGVFKLFDDLLIGVRSKIEAKIGVKWCKPLFLCPPCMGSFHGLILCVFVFHMYSVPGAILYCVCLCGLNYIIQQFLPDYD